MSPEQVTDVVFSHHHPDHTLNAALFPHARAHDVWAAYHNHLWYDRPADGYQLSPSIRLIETPGHTPQDISTVAETAEGTVVLTHAWWSVHGPAEDPTSDDHEGLRASRRKILALKPALIVPGHGDPFVPDENTPI
ncbi:MBL fold metallo-hydrolase [Streptomyces rectiviolaceus]|uniref:MBL fold metallo-hydrolase n=1 Tax=Streptomyces rectiviolaceus TaxID=332591 RepID=UPI0031D5D175